MIVDVITPDKTIFSGDLESVIVPGIDGFFEILNHHAPLVSILVKGTLKLTNSKKETQELSINGGVIEVNNNTVKILAE